MSKDNIKKENSNKMEYLHGHLFKIWMQAELSANVDGSEEKIQDILVDICDRVDPKELSQYFIPIIQEQVVSNNSSNVKALLDVANIKKINIDINASIDNSSKITTLFNSANADIQDVLTEYSRNQQLKAKNKANVTLGSVDDWAKVENLAKNLNNSGVSKKEGSSSKSPSFYKPPSKSTSHTH